MVIAIPLSCQKRQPSGWLCCVAEKISSLHITHMRRGEIFSTPCICANSEFSEAPLACHLNDTFTTAFDGDPRQFRQGLVGAAHHAQQHGQIQSRHAYHCLLYTSDAADDLLCVDLGGRRIIKKKKKNK